MAYYQIIIWLYDNCEELKGSDLLRGHLLRGTFPLQIVYALNYR